MVAQAVLHRELLHAHASLAHIHTLLQQPLALRSPPLLDRVTHPHLRAQLKFRVWTTPSCWHYVSTTPPFTTPTNSSLQWGCYISSITARNNLKLNFKAAPLSWTVRLFPLHRPLPLLMASQSSRADPIKHFPPVTPPFHLLRLLHRLPEQVALRFAVHHQDLHPEMILLVLGHALDLV